MLTAWAVADGRLLLVEEGFVGIRTNPYEQVALFHFHPVNHRQFNNFARNLRRDLHFRFGLNFTRRRNTLIIVRRAAFSVVIGMGCSRFPETIDPTMRRKISPPSPSHRYNLRRDLRLRGMVGLGAAA